MNALTNIHPSLHRLKDYLHTLSPTPSRDSLNTTSMWPGMWMRCLRERGDVV